MHPNSQHQSSTAGSPQPVIYQTVPLSHYHWKLFPFQASAAACNDHQRQSSQYFHHFGSFSDCVHLTLKHFVHQDRSISCLRFTWRNILYCLNLIAIVSRATFTVWASLSRFKSVWCHTKSSILSHDIHFLRLLVSCENSFSGSWKAWFLNVYRTPSLLLL